MTTQPIKAYTMRTTEWREHCEHGKRLRTRVRYGPWCWR